MRRFPSLFLLLLLWSPIAFTGPLGEGLRCEPHFVALSGESVSVSPETYFKSERELGRPRMILTIGLPGSGKSWWSNHAKDRGWSVISLSEIREQLRKSQKEIEEPVLLEKSYEIAKSQFHAALKEGKSVVWDSTNTSVWRSWMLVDARRAGYFTEALVFQSPSLEVNASNVASRVSNGATTAPCGS